MAQLPPKIPTVAPAWPEFGGGHQQQRSPSVGTFLAAAPMQPSWVDEFLDFSAAKRGAHRRSVSDSVMRRRWWGDTSRHPSRSL
ncbi:Basic leucine zipper 34 [Zea mays]|uniref:Basic leucine zipper 34 n=1 Tax=Zea mays TaxID=4577 RepID=A0A1D6MG26_MAIZE|nr:Basic leucine zipper 34 [Zea mays]